MKEIEIFFIFNLFVLFCNVNICSSLKTCITCTADNKKCINPIGHDEPPPALKCKDENDICYTKIVEDGRNERGCMKEEDCKKEENCFIAEGYYWNDRVIPWYRPVCHICRGKTCDDPTARQLKPEYCDFFNAKELSKCYTSYSTSNIIRGCVAGAKKEDMDFCVAEPVCSVKGCQLNDNSKPCNTEVVNLNKCFKCEDKLDTTCSNEFKEFKEFENCKEEKGCFERYKGGVASRGCAENLTGDELNECKDSKKKHCRHCDSPMCNSQKINGSSVIIISNLILISSIIINFKFF